MRNERKLYGREKQLTQIQEALFENRETVLILGDDSTGKTTILRSIRVPSRNNRVIHIESDFSDDSETIRAALSQLTTEIQLVDEHSDKSEHHQGFTTELSEFLADSTTVPVHKIEIAVKLMLQEISHTGRRVVWKIDNLHRASEASLKLIKSLVSDVTLVATSVQPLHIDHGVCEIQLDHLTLQDVRGIVQDCWGELSPDVSQRLHKMSDGNPLFLFELMKDRNFFNGLDDETPVTVEDLWRRRTEKLSDSSLTILKHASCLHFHRIDPSLIALATNQDTIEQDLQAILATGLIETVNNQWYFIHERLGSMLYSSLDRSEQSSLHYKIGRRLWRRLDKEKRENTYLEVIVHQLLRGKENFKQGEHLFVAALCLEAGKAASKFKSFSEASHYLMQGIGLLDEESWRIDYDLCLSLHCAAAEVCYCCLEFDRVKDLVGAVCAHAHEYEDTVPILQTSIYALASQGFHDDAINMGLNVLEELNEKLPRRPSLFNVMLALQRTKWLLHGRSDPFLLRLPPMTDSKKLAAMKICNLVLLSSYFARPLLAPILVARMIRLTVKFGQSEIASPVFSVYGMILCMYGSDVPEGYRYGRLSLSMYEEHQSDAWLCRVYVGFYGCLSPYKDHVATCSGPLMKAYRHGLATGDYEMAVNAAFICYGNQFDSKYLPQLEAETKALMNQMVTMGQMTYLNLLRLHLQAIQNFLGRVDDPRFLKGDILDADNELTREKEQKEPIVSLWAKFYCLLVAYYFCDYDLAASFCVGLIEKLKKSRGAAPGLAYVALTFYEGVALLASSKGSRRVPYVRRGLRKMEYYAQYSPLNFLGKVHLLKAELAVVTSRDQEVIPEFLSAILFSREAGFIQQEALANERLGKYCLSQNETDKGAHHLRCALELYRQWGGVAKVAQLQAEFPEILV